MPVYARVVVCAPALEHTDDAADAQATVGKGFTVKEDPLVTVPFVAVIEIAPVVPFPTVTVTDVAVLAVIVAAVPPMVTAVAPDKLVPLITIEEPTQPKPGKDVSVGGGI